MVKELTRQRRSKRASACGRKQHQIKNQLILKENKVKIVNRPNKNIPNTGPIIPAQRRPRLNLALQTGRPNHTAGTQPSQVNSRQHPQRTIEPGIHDFQTKG
jgi:hypothetical protein